MESYDLFGKILGVYMVFETNFVCGPRTWTLTKGEQYTKQDETELVQAQVWLEFGWEADLPGRSHN